MANLQLYDYYLQNLIKNLMNGHKFHISIHFLNGYLLDKKAFEIDPKNSFHNCEFCEHMKISSSGLRRCVKNKSLIIKKATENPTTHIGECHMGITEIVRPVFIGDKIYCIIFLGHLLKKSNIENVERKIKKRFLEGGHDLASALEKINTLEHIDDHSLDHYISIVDTMEASINLLINEFMKSSKLQNEDFGDKKNIHWIIRQTIYYIHQYYSSDLRLSAVASHFFVNPQYLCRLFAKETGMSFTEYANRVRIEKSLDMLEHTTLSITDIATKIGFNSVTYFNYVFKNIMNTTPVTYRHQFYENKGSEL